MVVGRRWVLKQYFVGMPKLEDFQLVEEELPELQEGEFLFHSLFIRYTGSATKYTWWQQLL